MEMLNWILLAAALAAMLPIAAFCVESLAALRPGDKRPRELDCCSSRRPRTAVLIPAHDEQLVIERTLRSIIPSLRPNDRLLVVADNCTDRTAELARRAGAEVVERNDPLRRGKGYALQFAFHCLTADPPDVAVVIDADTLPEPAALEIVSRRAFRTGRPVQARNLTDLRRAKGPIEAVSIFANRLTNLVRPLGLTRLGAPCRLTGTGMAFPWAILEESRPAGGNLVEDMQLGIDMALRGHVPLYCPEAGVSSEMPDSRRAFASQRTRWEQGHLRTALRESPRLFYAALRNRSWPLMAMAVDLCIPPLTLLTMLWSVLALASCAAWRYGASWLPTALLAAGGVAFVFALAAAWAGFCRRQVPLKALAAAPLYMLRKAPIYVRLLYRRQNVWVRTERKAVIPASAAPPNAGYTLSDGIANRHCRNE
ncbi:MAG: glycosyltransferase [Pirellulales bacterium]|nr:glycosyltransferase [Pirellulales bacterium]